MQMAYNAYNSLAQQKLMAESKLQERVPAFTVLQNASVPVKPAGPKRMITVAFLLIVAFVVRTIMLLLKTQEEDLEEEPADLDKEDVPAGE